MKRLALIPIVFVSAVACSHEPQPPSAYAPTDGAQVSVAAVDDGGGCGDAASCEWPRKNVVAVENVVSGETKLACPVGMIHIDGEFCAKDDQKCLRWRGGFVGQRCEEWRSPVHCLVSTVHKSYCIDRYEWPNVKGQVPMDWLSFNKAKKLAATEGKRLCTRTEWTMAALGPELHPYPFGSGFVRDDSCNIDNHIHGVDVMKVKDRNSEGGRALHDLLVPSGSMPRCISGYGVMDMAGNVDEEVVNETSRPYISGLQGGHVFGVRNASRPMTDAHGPNFIWYEVGTRACRDTNK